MSRANEPAYPVTPTDRTGQIAETQHGLTIREHFAALAMQGLLSADGRNGETWETVHLIRAAVKHADALIAELSKMQP